MNEKISEEFYNETKKFKLVHDITFRRPLPKPTENGAKYECLGGRLLSKIFEKDDSFRSESAFDGDINSYSYDCYILSDKGRISLSWDNNVLNEIAISELTVDFIQQIHHAFEMYYEKNLAYKFETMEDEQLKQPYLLMTFYDIDDKN